MGRYNDLLKVIPHPTHPDNNKQVVIAKSGKLLCEFTQLEDGFWYAVFVDLLGCWDGWVLREIADYLEDLNKPWLEHLNTVFNGAQ